MSACHSKMFLMSIKFSFLKLLPLNWHAKKTCVGYVFKPDWNSICLLLVAEASGMCEYAIHPYFHTFAFSTWIMCKTYIKLLDFNSVHLLLLLQLVLHFRERLFLLLPFCLLTKWKHGDSCYKMWFYTRHVLEDTPSLSNLRYSL